MIKNNSTSICECGRRLDADEVFCSACGRDLRVQVVATPATQTPQVAGGSRKVITVLVIGVLALGVIAVLGTRSKCIETRLGMGILSGLAEQGGGDFDQGMGLLSSQVRCPLGGTYSYTPDGGTACSIHGRVTEADLRSRGVY